MKAINIIMFLLIFNVSISIVGGLNIYHMGLKVDEQYDINTVEESSGTYHFIGSLMTQLTVFGIGGAILGVLTRRSMSESAAYGFFSGLISTVFVSTYAILSGISTVLPADAAFAANVVIGLFLGICGLLCALAMVQLIRGGIDAYM